MGLDFTLFFLARLFELLLQAFGLYCRADCKSYNAAGDREQVQLIARKRIQHK